MPGLIIEGPDGAGKSTLVKALGHELDWPVVRCANRPGTPDPRTLINLVSRCSPLLFDRSYPSELVYGRMLRGGRVTLDPHDVWAIEGLHVAFRYHQVICLTDDDAMLANNLKTAQLLPEVETPDGVDALHRGYVGYLQTTEVPAIVFDYQRDSVDDLVQFVLSTVVTETEVVPGLSGSRTPRRWLVGDERGDHDVALARVAFYTPGSGSNWVSGTLLDLAMTRCGWTWHDTVVSNSVVEGSELELAAVHEQLGYPSVVALGRAASARLSRRGVRHQVVPHPQYWRRFYARELSIVGEKPTEARQLAVDQYAVMLKKAAAN